MAKIAVTAGTRAEPRHRPHALLRPQPETHFLFQVGSGQDSQFDPIGDEDYLGMGSATGQGPAGQTFGNLEIPITMS